MVTCALWRFMQLNPARGRKLQSSLEANVGPLAHAVYAAQFREGTETHRAPEGEGSGVRFMQLNPARGRKLEEVDRKPDHRRRSKIYAS